MNKLFVYLCICLCSLVCACSDNNEEQEDILEISADKTTILANGQDVVTFTVTNEDGQNVTSECTILNGNTELAADTFSTTIAGEYEFTARRIAGGVSDKIKIIAIEADVQLKIEADKLNFVADGGDIVALKLVDENNNDLTSETEFYMNGILLKRNAARSKQSGSHTITAKWKGKTCEHALTLTGGVAPSDFTGRLLVEYSTATTCMYCPPFIQAFRACCSNSRFALVSVHREPSSIYSDYYEQSSKDRIQDFVDYYTDRNGDGVPYPGAFFNRGADPVHIDTKDQVLAKIPEKSDVGIALDAYFDGLQFKVNVAVHAKSSFTGKMGAILVEDGIRAFQTKLGDIDMEKTMRDYQPSVAGETVTFSAGTPVVKEYVFDKCGVKKTNKCEIIVFVTGEDQLLKNVQRVAVGKVIGY